MIGKARRWTARRSPLVVLLFTPLVTAPVSAVLVFGFSETIDPGVLGLPRFREEGPFPATNFYLDFWPTWLLLIGPGFLNLLVALWFFQRNGYVRVAAALALVVAAIRTFVVPVLYFSLGQSDIISHDGGRLMRMEVENTGFLLGRAPTPEIAKLQLLVNVWLHGAYAWGATIALAGLFNLLMDRIWPGLKPPRKRQPGEPRSWGSFIEGR